MHKLTNKDYRERLKKFKGGHRSPEELIARFYNGEYKEEVYSNEGKSCGKKLGDTTMYEAPRYEIYKNDEHIFSIEAFEEGVMVVGDYNTEMVDSWKEAIEIGLELVESGY